jgi:hypothetical protein
MVVFRQSVAGSNLLGWPRTVHLIVPTIAHARGAQLIVDGALSFGTIEVDLQAMDCRRALYLYAAARTGSLRERYDEDRSPVSAGLNNDPLSLLDWRQGI